MIKTGIRLFAWAHRWVGFVIGLLFLIILVSGIYTGAARLVDRYATDYGEPYVRQDLSQKADAVSHMTQAYPNATAFIMPHKGQPYYQATSRRRAAHLALGDLSELSNEIVSSGAVQSYMLSLHRNFARGRADRWIVAWVSLIAVGVAIAGLVASVPYWRRLRKKDLVPKKIDRPYLYRSHFTLGLIALPLIIVMGLTGAAVTYRDQANTLLGAERRHMTQTVDPVSFDADPSWLGVLKYAQETFDGAKLVRITKPRGGGGDQIIGQAYELRFRVPGDWHPSGASYVLIDDATWGIVAINRFANKSLGQKLSEMMRSIHDGRSMPNWYVVILLVLNLLIAVLVLMGLFSFFQRAQSVPRLPLLKSKSDRRVT